MPNSLEQFEAKYGKRGDGSLSYAGWDFRWEAWQAGAAAENERLARKAENMTDGWHSLTPEEIRDRGIT